AGSRRATGQRFARKFSKHADRRSPKPGRFVAFTSSCGLPSSAERTGETPMATPTRPCPYCGAAVLMNAPACGTCGRPMPPMQAGAPPGGQPAKTMFGYAAPVIPRAGQPGAPGGAPGARPGAPQPPAGSGFPPAQQQGFQPPQQQGFAPQQAQSGFGQS